MWRDLVYGKVEYKIMCLVTIFSPPCTVLNFFFFRKHAHISMQNICRHLSVININTCMYNYTHNRYTRNNKYMYRYLYHMPKNSINWSVFSTNTDKVWILNTRNITYRYTFVWCTLVVVVIIKPRKKNHKYR